MARFTSPDGVGAPGPAGPTGLIGPTGPQGATGPQGIQGETGPQGNAGSDAPTNRIYSGEFEAIIDSTGATTFDGNIIPSVNNTFTLGTTDARFADIFVGPGSLIIADETEGLPDQIISARDGYVYVREGVDLLPAGFDIGSFVVAPSGIVTVHSDTIIDATKSLVNINATESNTTYPRNFAGTLLQLTAQDNENARVVLDSFGANKYATFIGRSARGTVTAPEATQANDTLMRMTVNGFGSSEFKTSIGRIDIGAAENFTDTAAGTFINFQTTPIGSTAARDSARIGNNGLKLNHGGITFADDTYQDTAQLIGPTGPQGSTGPIGPQGVQGIQGEQGTQGDQGQQGNPGTGIAVGDYHDTYAELIAEHPTGIDGEAHIVGGDLYIWNTTLSQWQNAGSLLGPQGIQGQQGIQGEQGIQGVQGIQGIQGETGPAGQDGQDATLPGAWTTYVPTWTASITNPTIGNGSITGAYATFGKTVHFRIKVTDGSTTNEGNGNYSVTLPVAPLAGTVFTFDGSTGSGVYRIYGIATGGSTALPLYAQSATVTSGSMTKTFPATLSTGDTISINGTYEIA